MKTCKMIILHLCSGKGKAVKASQPIAALEVSASNKTIQSQNHF